MFLPAQYSNLNNQQGPFVFDRATLQRFLSFCEIKSYGPKQNIFLPGDDADKLYYIISGNLVVLSIEEEPCDSESEEKIKKHRPRHTLLLSDSNQKNLNKIQQEDNSEYDGIVEERELVVHQVGPGDFIGALGLFSPSHKRNVALRTCSSVEVAAINYEKLLKLMSNELASDCPKILYEVGQQTSRRLLTITRKASGLAFIDVRERIMRSVIELASQSNALTHPQGMQIKVSRQELARMSGCSRETAGKALKELQKEGRLTAHGKTIVVFGTR